MVTGPFAIFFSAATELHIGRAQKRTIKPILAIVLLDTMKGKSAKVIVWRNGVFFIMTLRYV
jgi:hypothetical protein